MSIDYKYKDLKDFKRLSNFQSVKEFDAYLDTYTQDCLDNTGGGSGGIQCFIYTDVWDRELNTYYMLLKKQLNKDGAEELRTTQSNWLKLRDNTRSLSFKLADRKYEGQSGTMFSLMRVGEISDIMYPIIKERAITLKHLYELSIEKLELTL